MPAEVLELGIEDAVYTFGMSTFLFLHHPGQFTSPDSKTKIPLVLGEGMYLDVTHEVTQDMPLEREMLRKEDGEDWGLIKSESISIAHTYTTYIVHEMTCDDRLDFAYDSCLYEGVSEGLLQTHNCIPPYVVPTPNVSVCKLQNFSTQEQEDLNRAYFGNAKHSNG